MSAPKDKENPLRMTDYSPMPPAPPNPSVAPSVATNQPSTRGTTPSLLRDDDESAEEVQNNLSDSDDDDDLMFMGMGNDGSCSRIPPLEDGVLAGEIPRRAEDFMERFSALSLVDLGIFNSLQMMERGKDPSVLTNRYEVIDGLTTSETKRQIFHCYLKESGLLGAIAKGILALYAAEEFPPYSEVGEFLANQMGYSMTIRDQIAEAKAYNNLLNTQIQRLGTQNDWLRRRLDDFMVTETPIEMLDPDLFDPNINAELPEPVKITRRPHLLKSGKRKVFPGKGHAVEAGDSDGIIGDPNRAKAKEIQSLLKWDDTEVLRQSIADLDKELEQQLNENKKKHVQINSKLNPTRTVNPISTPAFRPSRANSTTLQRRKSAIKKP